MTMAGERTLQIGAQARQEMFEHCRREYPNEACGVLAGRDGEVTHSFPIRNDAASPTWYEMSPADQLKTQKEIRRLGIEQLAVYHSHVATEAYPSRRDVERATAVQDFFDGYYVLVTLKDPLPHARAFRIQDGNVNEEPLVET